MSKLADQKYAIYKDLKENGPRKQDGLDLEAVNSLVADGKIIMYDCLLYTDEQWKDQKEGV